MFTILLSDLKKIFNIGAIRNCWQCRHRKTQNALNVSIILLMCWSSGQVFAGAEVCQQFTQPELKSLCNQFPASQVTVHNHVTGQNLNSLRDSWGTTSGLHILPPGSYALTRAIELDANQAILPHPSMPLPDNQALRTIILTAGSDFRISNGHLYLLKLRPGSSAGGVEIHSTQLANSLSSTGSNSLLWIEPGGKISLVGSYLTSTPSGHSLEQLVQISSDGSDNSGGGEVYLAKNLFKASSLYGLVAHMQSDQRITIDNTLVRLSNQNGAGVVIFKGTGSVTNSDFVLEGDCSSGDCSGISFNQTKQHSVSRSTFWTTVTNPQVVSGIKLNNLNPPGFVLDKGTSGWLGTNLFSPEMAIMNDVEPSYDETLAERQLRTAYLNQEYPLDAVQFFNYAGKIGVTGLPSQVVQNACKPNATADIMPVLFQNEADFSNSSFDLYYPPARFDLTCPPRHCVDASQTMSYVIAGEFFGGSALIITLSIMSYVVGRYLRPSVTYQEMPADH